MVLLLCLAMLAALVWVMEMSEKVDASVVPERLAQKELFRGWDSDSLEAFEYIYKRAEAKATIVCFTVFFAALTGVLLARFLVFAFDLSSRRVLVSMLDRIEALEEKLALQSQSSRRE